MLIPGIPPPEFQIPHKTHKTKQNFKNASTPPSPLPHIFSFPRALSLELTLAVSRVRSESRSPSPSRVRVLYVCVSSRVRVRMCGTRVRVQQDWDSIPTRVRVQIISSTRRRMAVRYCLPTPRATFTSAIFRAKMEFKYLIASPHLCMLTWRFLLAFFWRFLLAF